MASHVERRVGENDGRGRGAPVAGSIRRRPPPGRRANAAIERAPLGKGSIQPATLWHVRWFARLRCSGRVPPAPWRAVLLSESKLPNRGPFWRAVAQAPYSSVPPTYGLHLFRRRSDSYRSLNFLDQC